MDKIGEVIGPKGKVINTITQETGADVSVSDDGVVGTVSIGSNDGDRGRRGPSSDRADPRPAHRRARRRVHRQGGERHQVRCVRQHPSRDATACSTSRSSVAASASTGSRTSSTSATRSPSASTTSTTPASSRSPLRATSRQASDDGVVQRRRAQREPCTSERCTAERVAALRVASQRRQATARVATSRPHRSTTRGTHRPSAEFGDLGPAEVGRPRWWRPAANAAVARAAAAVVVASRCQGRHVTRR